VAGRGGGRHHVVGNAGVGLRYEPFRGILTPTVLWGCFVLARRFPTQAPRVLLAAGLINLLLPAVHVVYTKIDLISPLPLELFRMLRGG
jgi:hypothetical protein